MGRKLSLGVENSWAAHLLNKLLLWVLGFTHNLSISTCALVKRYVKQVTLYLHCTDKDEEKLLNICPCAHIFLCLIVSMSVYIYYVEDC